MICISSIFFWAIHPCDKKDKGDCQQICEKDGTEAKCKCEKDFKLNDDGKTCDSNLLAGVIL